MPFYSHSQILSSMNELLITIQFMIRTLMDQPLVVDMTGQAFMEVIIQSAAVI